MSGVKPQNLREKVSKWLEEQGYPLEMEVARAFSAAEFATSQSHYFVDPESSVPREIDVTASKFYFSNGVAFKISFHLECKSSKEKPWLLFTAEQGFIRSPISWCLASRLGKLVLQEFADEDEIRSLRFFLPLERFGYGITVGLTSGKDIAYEAIIKAAKSASATVLSVERLEDPLLGEVAIPVVVVDGALFECCLDEDSNVVVSEIEAGILAWQRPIVGVVDTHLPHRPYTAIRISTVGNLSTLVQEADEIAHAFLERGEQVTKIAEKLKQELASEKKVWGY